MAEQYLKKAMQYPTTLAHQIASKMLVDWQQYERAIEEAERSIVLDPSDPNSYRSMAYALIYAGKPEAAVRFVEKSMRLDPQYPAYNLFVLGLAYFSMERFEEAVTSFQRALSRNPENSMILIYLSAAYALTGRPEEANATIEKLKKALPMMTLEFLMGSPLWRYKNRTDNKRLRDGLRMAGLM
jgi:tetratricopeptide (TPR) repeat protein